MQKNSDIHLLHNNEIDKQQWDECIGTSPNRLIYAKSFYLDNICPQWKALTGENYEWVFPVTHNTKFGISYLYQPPFTQQLGVFSKPDVIVPFKEIIQWLKNHYRFWEINWNYSTNSECIHAPVHITAATNFILDLSKSYESIAANYHKDLIKNIKRSKHFELRYHHTYDYNKGIELFKKYYANRLTNIKGDDYKSLSNICGFALEKDMFIGREAVSRDNELMATALLLSDGKRLYNLMNTTTEAGRRAEANHFLLDSIIKEFSCSELLFDFEGSDLTGVKSFYKNFGAENQPYYLVKYNDLPWPVRLFKK